MKKSIYVLALVALFFSACKNDKKQANTSKMQSKEMKMDKEDDHDHDHSSMNEERKIETTTRKSASTSEIIEAYLQIKNALTNDDKKKAAKAGSLMLTAFSNFDMTKLAENQHKEYMEIVENATEQAEHIVKSPIDHQREHFEVLSTDINDLITLLGTDKTLYQDFCPMFNNGKGAIWLSETEEIKNPYLGTKMPTCGKVKKKIN